MIILSFIILTLIYSRKYFPIHKILINRFIIALSLWLVIGTTLRYFIGEPPQRHYTDVQMAQKLINEDSEFKKAKMKILDDGGVKIILKKKKYLLKDGVLTKWK